ncbi:ribosomal protein uS13 [Candidatus Vidania fulgoroideorum]
MNILGINLNNYGLIEIELTKIYGIGYIKSRSICNKISIIGKRVINISSSEFISLNYILKGMLLGNQLKLKVRNDISNLIRINCYRGIRHKLKLPVRGQRTRSNSRTSRKFFI